VYVGTYTGGQSGSEGIYLFKLQTQNLDVSQNITLVPLGLASATPNPSFLTIDAKRRLLFAVNELDRFEGEQAGSVSSFEIDSSTGKLTLLNSRSSQGAGPCHVILDHEGRNVLVANYGEGSVAVLPVQADGRLSEASAVVQHEGKSLNPERQAGPHAHCVTLDPTGRIAFVCDLGLDQILAYDYDAEEGSLTPHDPPFTSLKPGAGPRHMTFHPSGRFAYVINELDSTVAVFSFDAASGTLKEVQTITTLPESFDGTNTTAEVAVHPSGEYLYASNRGADSVILFEIDEDDGTLTHIEDQGTGGRTPRHFGIQPSGDHMVIANQNSDSLLACRIDEGNGRLKPSGVFAQAPSPVCAVFLPTAGEDR
jgi:6-phosphogluconolactonase